MEKCQKHDMSHLGKAIHDPGKLFNPLFSAFSWATRQVMVLSKGLGDAHVGVLLAGLERSERERPRVRSALSPWSRATPPEALLEAFWTVFFFCETGKGGLFRQEKCETSEGTLN